MSEHYPSSLEGETIWQWCDRCEAFREFRIVRKTEHACVLGPCLHCELRRAGELRQKDEAAVIQAALASRQGKLFG